ncbi:uncharacterized protein EI90DRAFT_1638180 [Cantharellus anzutake]|uniref:uncharacterized protein n=1 Tax=Cantharellus anzutake TaxID=1750568 RepID=UPI001905E196|nr:uncharacterized protein EI90DRAFT_1638180 [Cantharellus anzutake]KAF8327887.1 hypothetical protein EI90DRAFT_1638180 [Cantharellus anzutake]
MHTLPTPTFEMLGAPKKEPTIRRKMERGLGPESTTLFALSSSVFSKHATMFSKRIASSPSWSCHLASSPVRSPSSWKLLPPLTPLLISSWHSQSFPPHVVNNTISACIFIIANIIVTIWVGILRYPSLLVVLLIAQLDLCIVAFVKDLLKIIFPRDPAILVQHNFSPRLPVSPVCLGFQRIGWRSLVLVPVCEQVFMRSPFL